MLHAARCLLALLRSALRPGRRGIDAACSEHAAYRVMFLVGQMKSRTRRIIVFCAVAPGGVAPVSRLRPPPRAWSRLTEHWGAARLRTIEPLVDDTVQTSNLERCTALRKCTTHFPDPDRSLVCTHAAAHQFSETCATATSCTMPMACMPLSTYMVMPVTAPASGETRKAAVWPTSVDLRSFGSGAFAVQ